MLKLIEIMQTLKEVVILFSHEWGREGEDCQCDGLYIWSST